MLQLEGVQPTTTPDDCDLADTIIMSDPRIRRLLAERYGITDPDLVVFDPWSLHGTPEEYKGRRLMQVTRRHTMGVALTRQTEARCSSWFASGSFCSMPVRLPTVMQSHAANEYACCAELYIGCSST